MTKEGTGFAFHFVQRGKGKTPFLAFLWMSPYRQNGLKLLQVAPYLPTVAHFRG